MRKLQPRPSVALVVRVRVRVRVPAAQLSVVRALEVLWVALVCLVPKLQEVMASGKATARLWRVPAAPDSSPLAEAVGPVRR